MFVDKQQKQKFDDISAGHEAALIAMGIIAKAERKEEKGPECPSVFTGAFEKYRSLKFLQRETGDTIKLYPREMLTWQDIVAFRNVTGQDVSILEAELIMGLDAIFEDRHDG